MYFQDRVLQFMDRAPERWEQKLSLSEYASLEDAKKRYYKPLFDKYKTKKIRDYDPEYGYFVGWRPIQIGLGNPVAYEYVGYLSARMIDDVFRSNILMERILS